MARGVVPLAAVVAPLALASHDSRSSTAQAASGDVGAPAAVARGHVTVRMLDAPTGVRRQHVWIYWPSVPNSRSLPIVYWLHGVPDLPGEIFQAGLGHTLDAYFAAGHRPFVVVAPDGSGAFSGDTEWADAANGVDREESFLLHSVMPAIEGRFPRDRAHRAIAGFSMGGYGAMNVALRHPDLFGQVASLSGYFHVDDPQGVFGGRAELVAANSPDQHVQHARGMRILLDVGTQDDQGVVHGEAQRFWHLLGRVGIPSTLIVAPEAQHNYTFVHSQFPVIETFLDFGWPS